MVWYDSELQPESSRAVSKWIRSTALPGPSEVLMQRTNKVLFLSQPSSTVFQVHVPHILYYLTYAQCSEAELSLLQKLKITTGTRKLGNYCHRVGSLF